MRPIVRTFSAMLLMFILAGASARFLYAQLSQQTYTVTGPNGITGTITVATQPASQPSSPPPSSQPVVVVTPPASQPTSQPAPPVIVTAPTTRPNYAADINQFETADSFGLPGWIGQAYSNAIWLSSMKWLADGTIDYTPWIQGHIQNKTAGYLSATALSWPSLAGVPRYSDLASAEAAGVTGLLLPRGQPETASMWDQNVENSTGIAALPVMFCSIGPNGYTDFSAPDPVAPAGLGLNDSRPGHSGAHYVCLGHINFTGSGQPQCIGQSDPNTSTPSDHVLLSNLNVQGFTTGIDFSGLNFQDSNLIIYRCAIHNNFAYNYGVYTYGWTNVDYLQSVVANNGWDLKAAPKFSVKYQGIYDGVTNPLLSADPIHRCIDCTLAANSAAGAQFNEGVIADSDLLLAGTIGAVAGGGYRAGFNHCVIDGDNLEFDKISSVGNSNGTVTASGTPGCALAMGPFGNGTTVPYTGMEYGMGIKLDAASSGSFVTDNIFTDKPDVINSNPWLQINTVDQNKTPVLVPTVGNPIYVEGNKVHGYSQWPITNSTTWGPNVIGFSTQDGNPPVTTGSVSVVYEDNICPGVTGVTGIISVEPPYEDAAANVSTYAKTLGIAGVVDGPSFLAAEEANCIAGTWNPALTADAAINWINAGFTPAQ